MSSQMSEVLWGRLLTHLCVLLLAVSLHAEIIDRIAVSVGNRVITTSELNLQIRVAAFLNGAKPDFTPAARRAMAQRMVEQTLIRQALESNSYPLPASSEVDPALQAFRGRFHPDPAEFARALAGAGITEQDLRSELLWQRTLTQFVDMRFRPGLQVTDAEIQQYFDQVVAPLAKAAHPGQPVNLDDYRSDIETKLTGDRADQEMDKWLQEARTRTEVVFHEEVFQ
jgi:hypothetical protein